MTPETIRQYACTVLELGSAVADTIDLRRPVLKAVGEELLRLGLSGPFAVVTPLNPLGVTLGEAENQARLNAFRASLGEAFGFYVEATGRSPDGAHREVGVALLTSQSKARALATEWDQDAFFWFDGAVFWLVGAGEDATRERLPLAAKIARPVPAPPERTASVTAASASSAVIPPPATIGMEGSPPPQLPGLRAG